MGHPGRPPTTEIDPGVVAGDQTGAEIGPGTESRLLQMRVPTKSPHAFASVSASSGKREALVGWGLQRGLQNKTYAY